MSRRATTALCMLVTAAFSIPIGISFVVNPYTEKPFATFSFSL